MLRHPGRRGPPGGQMQLVSSEILRLGMGGRAGGRAGVVSIARNRTLGMTATSPIQTYQRDIG